ncbi:hypothetical protein ACFWGP_08895 [Agromyces sp. NPDC127015]|uniref:hypothetical protein n=1 Tax=Agromyces sp. NPDC127015 TaxID=3347108 RepID=UPI003662A189
MNERQGFDDGADWLLAQLAGGAADAPATPTAPMPQAAPPVHGAPQVTSGARSAFAPPPSPVGRVPHASAAPTPPTTPAAQVAPPTPTVPSRHDEVLDWFSLAEPPASDTATRALPVVGSPAEAAPQGLAPSPAAASAPPTWTPPFSVAPPTPTVHLTEVEPPVGSAPATPPVAPVAPAWDAPALPVDPAASAAPAAPAWDAPAAPAWDAPAAPTAPAWDAPAAPTAPAWDVPAVPAAPAWDVPAVPAAAVDPTVPTTGSVAPTAWNTPPAQPAPPAAPAWDAPVAETAWGVAAPVAPGPASAPVEPQRPPVPPGPVTPTAPFALTWGEQEARSEAELREAFQRLSQESATVAASRPGETSAPEAGAPAQPTELPEPGPVPTAEADDPFAGYSAPPVARSSFTPVGGIPVQHPTAPPEAPAGWGEQPAPRAAASYDAELWAALNDPDGNQPAASASASASASAPASFVPVAETPAPAPAPELFAAAPAPAPETSAPMPDATAAEQAAPPARSRFDAFAEQLEQPYVRDASADTRTAMFPAIAPAAPGVRPEPADDASTADTPTVAASILDAPFAPVPPTRQPFPAFAAEPRRPAPTPAAEPVDDLLAALGGASTPRTEVDPPAGAIPIVGTAAFAAAAAAAAEAAASSAAVATPFGAPAPAAPASPGPSGRLGELGLSFGDDADGADLADDDTDGDEPRGRLRLFGRRRTDEADDEDEVDSPIARELAETGYFWNLTPDPSAEDPRAEATGSVSAILAAANDAAATGAQVSTPAVAGAAAGVPAASPFDAPSPGWDDRGAGDVESSVGFDPSSASLAGLAAPVAFAALDEPGDLEPGDLEPADVPAWDEPAGWGDPAGRGEPEPDEFDPTSTAADAASHFGAVAFDDDPFAATPVDPSSAEAPHGAVKPVTDGIQVLFGFSPATAPQPMVGAFAPAAAQPAATALMPTVPVGAASAPSTGSTAGAGLFAFAGGSAGAGGATGGGGPIRGASGPGAGGSGTGGAGSPSGGGGGRGGSGSSDPTGGDGKRGIRPLVWIAGALVALLVIAGLFWLGTQMSKGGGAAASGTPTAETSETPTPEPTAAQPAGVHAWDTLFGGECLEPYTDAWQQEFTVVDCATPHAAQLVYRGTLPGDAAAAYPGETELASQMNLLCTADGVIDVAAVSGMTDLQVQGAYPADAAQWDAGARYYYCFASRSSGEKLTASIAGPGPAA